MATGDRCTCTCPAQAREAMDRIEAAIAAEGSERAHPLGGDLHGDWVADVPGSAEPPD